MDAKKAENRKKLLKSAYGNKRTGEADKHGGYPILTRPILSVAFYSRIY
jgi:hypothetical protein